MFLISLLIWKKLLKMSLFCRKLVEMTPQKRLFLWSFGYWASIFNHKNKDRFEHEIVLEILTKSEPRCSYKIVLIKKRVYLKVTLNLTLRSRGFLFQTQNPASGLSEWQGAIANPGNLFTNFLRTKEFIVSKIIPR